MYLRFLRDVFFVNYPILWINFCQNANAVFQRFEHTILFISCLKHGNPAVDKGKSWCLIKGALSGLRKILATESSTERSNFPTSAS